MEKTYYSEREQQLISGLAQSGQEIEQLEAERIRLTNELERWQKAIYELCKRHKPDVDGAGSDGDELDLTLSEINEVFIMYQDEIHEMKEAFDWLAKRVKKLPTWVEENSYAAQVDMRERAYDLVVFAQAGKYTKAEEA